MKKSRKNIMQYCLKFDYMQCKTKNKYLMNLIRIIKTDFDSFENSKWNS